MFRNCLRYRLSVTTIGLAALIVLTFNEPVFAKSNPSADISELKDFFAVLHYVTDGDSFVVRNNRSKLSIRLWGIDAPEFDQPHSKASKDALQRLLSNKNLRIILKDIDKYGRIVAIVNVGNISVNSALVANGSAWVHDYYCKEPVCLRWYKLEEKARNNKSGLWRESNAIEPWVWKSKK